MDRIHNVRMFKYSFMCIIRLEATSLLNYEHEDETSEINLHGLKILFLTAAVIRHLAFFT